MPTTALMLRATATLKNLLQQWTTARLTPAVPNALTQCVTRLAGKVTECVSKVRGAVADRPIEVALFSSPCRNRSMGAILFFGHPFFGYLETTVIAQPYENLWIRAAMSLTGLILLFGPLPGDPRSRTASWINSAVWFFNCVVFMGWMYFNNHGSPLWLATFCVMTVMYFTLTDWRLALLGSAVGMPLAYFLHTTITDASLFTPVRPGEQIAVIGFAYMLAIWASYTAGNLRAERLRVVGQLMGILAHELRTPIATMSMTSELLDGRGSADDRRIAASIRDAVLLMNGVLDLQIANSRAFSLKFHRAPTLASDLCKSFRESYPFRSRCERSHVEFAVESNYQIDIAPKLLHSVLANVLKNAIEAVSAARGRVGQGDVAVTFFRRDKFGCVKIRDRGIGMDSTTRSKMFEPFFSTSQLPGHGLGLALVKRVVDLAGGKIVVESELETGTAVLLCFPLSAHVPQTESHFAKLEADVHLPA